MTIMNTAIRRLMTPTLAAQAVTCAIAMGVTEAFYKFGSFTLEALGFLATWGVLMLLAKPMLPKQD